LTQAPPWTTDQLALLADGRLTGDARVIGLLLSHAGEQGLSYAELEELLPDASRDRLRVAIQKLERCKWADRLIGGKGHSDRFIYIACPPDVTYRENRLADLGILIYRMPASSTLKAFSVPATGTLSPPSSSSNLPLPPPPDAHAREGVSPEAEQAIEESDELLAGCRGSLRDYLAARVKPEHQHGYVRKLQGALRGLDEFMWTDRKARKVTTDRTAILASAFNELLSGGEVAEHFRGPPGDFGNLRTTVRFLVAAKLGTPADTPPPPVPVSTRVSTRQKFPAPEVSRAP
jgi:hypothetical protein